MASSEHQYPDVVEVATVHQRDANRLLAAGWALLLIQQETRVVDLKEPGPNDYVRQALTRRTSFVLGRTSDVPAFRQVMDDVDGPSNAS